jgi:glycosyltransferase involved in cell wall biosynthesis
VISVALATCQGERWIEAQVASILEQLGPQDELVVADASSTDRTLDIVRELGADRATILEGLPRGNVAATFEAALKECRGDTVFLSDQDDVWLPHKVDRCVAALSGTAPLVLHDARVIDGEGQILSESFLRQRRRRDGFWPNLWRPGYLGCAVAFRRELLDLALPFPPGVPMHDWWLGLLAERRGGVAVLREPLILHRRHGANANFDPNQSPYSLTRRLLFRWKIWGDVRRRLEERS